METAVNVPFEAGEIIHIVAEELQARLRGLSPLSQSKEYAAFSVDYLVTVRLRRTGETAADERATLAWGKVEKGQDGTCWSDDETVRAIERSDYQS